MPEEIEAMINSARHRAAREAYKAGHRSLAENVYNLTLGAADAQGVQKASFSTDTDLLPESIPVCNDIQHATVNAAVGLGFDILPSVSALRSARSDSLLAYAAVGDKGVYTRYPAGALAAGPGLLVRAVQVATLGAWPAQIEDRLIDALQELAAERQKAEPVEAVTAGVR